MGRGILDIGGLLLHRELWWESLLLDPIVAALLGQNLPQLRGTRLA